MKENKNYEYLKRNQRHKYVKERVEEVGNDFFNFVAKKVIIEKNSPVMVAEVLINHGVAILATLAESANYTKEMADDVLGKVWSDACECQMDDYGDIHHYKDDGLKVTKVIIEEYKK